MTQDKGLSAHHVHVVATIEIRRLGDERVAGEDDNE
jgi:hypothetical protein